MARFSLPPADVSWLDRAQSCDGVFPLSAGFVLDESGDPVVFDGDSPPWLLAQVRILARMRPLDRRARWTFSRYV